MSYTNLKLFALSSNQELAAKVADKMGIELGKSSVREFSDGEIQVNIEESIRGHHVFILQSTSSPVNDNLMEILIMVDALKRASAETVSVVMPYYGYARQDRKARSREPITSKLVANMLEVAGVDRLLTVDLHASQIQGFFDIPVDHLMGAPLIADYFDRAGLTGDDVVVVSPDHGGVTRARKLAQCLKTPIAIIDKRRSVDKMNTSEVMNIIGNVEGKTCILIDDMIDTAGTICHAADALAEAGATHVYASCTHPVLSGPALDNIQKSAIEKLVVLDTIYLPEERLIDKIEQISIADLISEAIIRIHEKRPLSPLFEMGHASQIQGFFDIPVDHLMGAPLIADYFDRAGLTGDDVVVVSPDHGGVTRARKLAQCLKTPIAIIDKRRSVDKMNTSEVMNIIGNVEGKTCILIDDMIDTAGTICHAADALAEAGATHVYASCTHPVLSGPALDNIQKSAIEKLVVLDTIYLPEERLIDKIEQISIADLISEAIIRIHEKRPLSPLFEMGHK